MASSISWTVKTVFGNKRAFIGVLTATDGTDAVATGLHRIDHVQVTTQTGAAAPGGVVINTAASGNGDVKLTSGTSAATYHIMVIGN